MAKLGDFSNAEVQLLGNFYFRAFFGFCHRHKFKESLKRKKNSSWRFYHYAVMETTGF
jgi:hypothetical protein